MCIYIHNRQYIHPNPKFSFFVLFPCRGEFQPEGHDAFPDAFPDASWATTFADPDPAEPAEPAENGGAVPPWRSQELPPPPKRVSSLATNNATVRVKRFPQGAADAADAVDAADGANGADGAHGQGAVDVDWKGKCEWITTGRPGHEWTLEVPMVNDSIAQDEAVAP